MEIEVAMVTVEIDTLIVVVESGVMKTKVIAMVIDGTETNGEEVDEGIAVIAMVITVVADGGTETIIEEIDDETVMIGGRRRTIVMVINEERDVKIGKLITMVTNVRTTVIALTMTQATARWNHRGRKIFPKGLHLKKGRNRWKDLKMRDQ